MRLLALVVAVGLGLAGCTATGDDAGDRVALGGGRSVQLEEVENTDTRGSISGVVVDEAIRPLAGVNLTLSDLQRSTSTDAQGLFVFADLDPGLYTVGAAPLVTPTQRFLGSQTTAEVQAGQTAKVRMVLPTDLTPVARHGETLSFTGFFQAGSGFVDEVLQLYVYNKTVGPVTTPSVTCTCFFTFFAEEPAETVVLELTYEDSVPNPAPQSSWVMDIYSDEDGRGNDLLFCEATPPCVFHVDRTVFTEEARTFRVGVWESASWVHVNQQFQLFATIFYVSPAPEGWSFIAGDP